MKVVFLGSSDFAVPSLEALLKKHEVLAVFTQPDRKKGRALHMAPTPVKEFALSKNLEVFGTENINAEIARLEKFNADIFVVVSFGQKLSREILSLPKSFCVNVHASLLPRLRGAGPINWAIINSDSVSGVTVMRMNERMDAGDIILSKSVEIKDEDDSMLLSKKLARAGAQALAEAMDQIARGKAVFTPQDEREVTFARKLNKEDGKINWKNSAGSIYNQVRGLLPWPCAYAHYQGKFIKILKTRTLASLRGTGLEDPGQIVGIEKGKGIIVAAGKGELLIEQLQPESKKAMPAYDFAIGHHVKLNDKFEE